MVISRECKGGSNALDSQLGSQLGIQKGEGEPEDATWLKQLISRRHKRAHHIGPHISLQIIGDGRKGGSMKEML